MKTLHLSLGVFCVFTLLFSACNTDVPTLRTDISQDSDSAKLITDLESEPLTTDSVDVFVTGAINVGNNAWKACYWRNDSIHVLDDSYSVANDIKVLDGKVIVAGKFNDKPCLWQDGERIVLDSQRDGEVKVIGVKGKDIYLVGMLYDSPTNFRAFLWKSNNMTFLNDYKGYASDIAFNGDNIFISGMDSEKPCYWKNGKKVELSEHFGHAYGLKLIGEDVLVAGEYRPNNTGAFLGGYWKNGGFQSPTGNNCYIWNIGVNNGDVFLVGSGREGEKISNAIVVNGQDKVALETPNTALSSACDVAFAGKNQYVLGTCSDQNLTGQSSQVCFWLNNRLHRVEKSYSVATSIYLKKKK